MVLFLINFIFHPCTFENFHYDHRTKTKNRRVHRPHLEHPGGHERPVLARLHSGRRHLSTASGALQLSLFFNDPAPAGVEGGGLRNAFVGQLMITSFATLIGVPVGVLGGTFLAEYARGTKIRAGHQHSFRHHGERSFHRGRNVRLCASLSGRSIISAAGPAPFALSIIMIPVVLRTTEDMLSLVPWTLREAAFALGAPYYKVIIQVVYRGAATGILTGVLLSIARVAGETAPLLFTSFNNNFFSSDMNQPHRIADRHDLSVRHGAL